VFATCGGCVHVQRLSDDVVVDPDSVLQSHVSVVPAVEQF
jgi:hypothetical protein